jgi:glycerate kinase
MKRVLIAFDKFKDALTAREAGEVVAAALREQRPDWTFDLAPLSDGGEGFTTILTQAVRGQEVACEVTGPRGKPVTAKFGLVPVMAIPSLARAQLALASSLAPSSKIAIIEMASASGLALLAQDERDPWQATTQGTGELMRAAAAAGASAFLIGMGGSATNDLGLGALGALGLRFMDMHDDLVYPPVPGNWERIMRLGGTLPGDFPPLRIACDVTNPLLGPRGAAAVYGSQKGLCIEDYVRLEHQAARVADMLCAHCGRDQTLQYAPGSGAAGGIAFGLMVSADAKLLPGFELVSAWLNLEEKLAAADVVITGEGRFDETSLEGKGPGALVVRALALGKTVHVFAGKIAAAHRRGLALHEITPAGMPLAIALRETPNNLAISTHEVFCH